MKLDDFLCGLFLFVFFGGYWYMLQTKETTDKLKANAKEGIAAFFAILIPIIGFLAVLFALSNGRRHY